MVTTEPQKPSGPPINIQIQPISSTELVVTWAPPHNDLQNGEILGYNIGFREERLVGPRLPNYIIMKHRLYSQTIVSISLY